MMKRFGELQIGGLSGRKPPGNEPHQQLKIMLAEQTPGQKEG